MVQQVVRMGGQCAYHLVPFARADRGGLGLPTPAEIARIDLHPAAGPAPTDPAGQRAPDPERFRAMSPCWAKSRRAARVPLGPRGERLLDIIARRAERASRCTRPTVRVSRFRHFGGHAARSDHRRSGAEHPERPEDVVTVLHQPPTASFALGAVARSAEVPFEGRRHFAGAGAGADRGTARQLRPISAAFSSSGSKIRRRSRPKCAHDTWTDDGRIPWSTGSIWRTRAGSSWPRIS